MTILDDIIAYKRDEVAAAKANAPFSAVDALARETAQPRGFERALRRRASDGPALIAEVKKASPSKGLIRADFDPSLIARAYEEGGATCLSVLTDRPSFQGAPEYLRLARDACRLPVLRKDFMIDPYQMAEARAWGADCVLLIMACLELSEARDLAAAARDYDLDVLVECHNDAEFDAALALESSLIGVNNRNLKTFETNLQTTLDLAARAPANVLLVSESGIGGPHDIAILRSGGAKAFLVGESLMRAGDVAAATRALLTVEAPRTV